VVKPSSLKFADCKSEGRVRSIQEQFETGQAVMSAFDQQKSEGSHSGAAEDILWDVTPCCWVTSSGRFE